MPASAPLIQSFSQSGLPGILSRMPDFLLEVGCEELPATFVERALRDLEAGLRVRLEEAALAERTQWTRLGTPRRLIVHVAGLKARQEDSVKAMRGPSLKAAFDGDGKPMPALQGFCRSNGVDPANVRDDGQYVWVDKTIEGRDAATLLAEIAPAAIRGLSFDKTMRWGSGRMRFARPIRWILAALDGSLVPFEVEAVASGLQSRGHRFYSPEPFEAGTLPVLLSGLRDRKVEPDPALRRQRIVQGAHAVADGKVDLPEALLDENVHLTEWPTPVAGRFRESFMELPEAVLVTAMAKHEKMFPVRDEAGKLTNQFVFVRNSGEDDTVRQGNEWVLNARFNDAKFFFDEDRKSTMADFLEKTSTIVFQEKLGSVRTRADRLSRLARSLAEQTGANQMEQGLAEEAGRYAKADLATGLVSELASLQGVIGGVYASREGMPSEVAWALGSQYDLSKNEDPGSCSGERTAIRLIVADQLDKLAGYLGLGLEPTGSSDPFGLRRAATILIEAAWKWHGPLPGYDALFREALEGYRREGQDLDEAGAERALADLFASRYASLMPEVRHDVLEGAMLREYPFELLMPRRVRLRAQMLTETASDTGFVQAATRPLNIVSAARKKGVEYAFDDPLAQTNADALDSEEGRALLALLKEQEDSLFRALRDEDGPAVVAAVRKLEQPIHRFFESTMVMVDEPAVRYARLSLLHACCLQLLHVGDFSKLEG